MNKKISIWLIITILIIPLAFALSFETYNLLFFKDYTDYLKDVKVTKITPTSATIQSTICNPYLINDYYINSKDDFDNKFFEKRNRISNYELFIIEDVIYNTSFGSECFGYKADNGSMAIKCEIIWKNILKKEKKTWEPVGKTIYNQKCYNIMQVIYYPFDLYGTMIDQYYNIFGHDFTEYIWVNVTEFNETFDNTDYVDLTTNTTAIISGGKVSLNISTTETTPGGNSTDREEYRNRSYDFGGEPSLNGSWASLNDNPENYGWVDHWGVCPINGYKYNETNVYNGNMSIVIGLNTSYDCGLRLDLFPNHLNTSSGNGTVEAFFYDCYDNISCRDTYFNFKNTSNEDNYLCGYMGWLSNDKYCYYHVTGGSCNLDRTIGWHRIRAGYNNTNYFCIIDDTVINVTKNPSPTRYIILKGSDSGRAGVTYWDNFRIYNGTVPPIGLIETTYYLNSSLTSTQLDSSKKIDKAKLTLDKTTFLAGTNTTCKMRTDNNAWQTTLNGTMTDLTDGYGLFYNCSMTTTNNLTTPEIDLLTIEVDIIDEKPPKYSNFTINSSTTYQNDVIMFKVNLTDDYRLYNYKFAHNQSGAFVNVSNVLISQNITYIVNETITVLTNNEAVCGVVWVNDTSNNQNVTNITCYQAINLPPTASLRLPRINYVNDTTSPLNITFNCTATDETAVKNISLYITNYKNESFSLNITNTTSTVKDQANWTLNLYEGRYNWSCEACDDDGDCILNSTNRSIKINSTLYNFTMFYNKTIHETSEPNHNITFIINPNHILNISSAYITWNKTKTIATYNKINDTLIIYNTTINTTLVITNNTDVNFTWSYNISYFNNTNDLIHLNGTKNQNQTLMYAYTILSSYIPQNKFETEEADINFIIFNPLNKSIVNGFVDYYNENVTVNFVDQYIDLNATIITGLVNSTNGIATINYTPYINIYYNGINITRNFSRQEQTVYQIFIGNCTTIVGSSGALANTTALIFKFYDEDKLNNINASISGICD